jgi:hypothetical protein
MTPSTPARRSSSSPAFSSSRFRASLIDQRLRNDKRFRIIIHTFTRQRGFIVNFGWETGNSKFRLKSCSAAEAKLEVGKVEVDGCQRQRMPKLYFLQHFPLPRPTLHVGVAVCTTFLAYLWRNGLFRVRNVVVYATIIERNKR